MTELPEQKSRLLISKKTGDYRVTTSLCPTLTDKTSVSA